jgi:hypothetical protein
MSYRLLESGRDFEIAPNGCWLWLRERNNKGYGRFRDYGRRWILAHRWNYLMFNGAIPPGRCVLHSCDTPACVNPEHLFLGTKKDNSQDMVRKGRNRPSGLQGENHGMAKLTAEQVVWYRRLVHRGVSRAFLARAAGVDRSTVENAVSGKKWGHL